MPIRPIDPAKRGIRPAGLAGPVRSRVRVRPSEPEPSSDDAEVPVSAPPPSSKRAHHIVDRTGPNWENGDYLVGKGRPPKATQWQKGQSGNPRGPKPAEKLDPEAAFDREVLAEFTAKVNGKEVRLNMGSFVVQLLKAGAAKGTVKSQQMLLELFLATVRKTASREEAPEVDAWEQQVIDHMLTEYGIPSNPVFRRIDRDAEGGRQ